MTKLTIDGKSYKLVGEAYISVRAFNGGFIDAKEGEQYLLEWEARAEDAAGDEFFIRWQFTVIKGDEPSDDDLPFDDEAYVTDVSAA